MRFSYYPGLVRVIQAALCRGEKVVGREEIGRRPVVVRSNITAEQCVLSADLVIAATNILILIDVCGQAETCIAATGTRGRQHSCQFQGGGIQQRSGELVVM